MENEQLGPAERITNSLLAYNDHMAHGRPGIVEADPSSTVGVRWTPVTHRVEAGGKVVYKLVEGAKKKTSEVKAGTMRDDMKVVEGGRVVGEYRSPGLFPEVAAWMYAQVAEVWRLNNEFAARWASYAFAQDHRDLKVVLAAFMLVQSRKGDPVLDDGKVIFNDEDFRDVGEAMMLVHKDKKSDLSPKLLLRIHDLLSLPQVAEINRKLGFGQSARHAFTGRWGKAAEKWLKFREDNPKLLESLVKAGYRTTVMELVRRSGFKPSSKRFFEILRWKQIQAKDGRRSLAIGDSVAEAETWEGLSEEQVCQRIVDTKPSYKRLVSLVPGSVGITAAVMAAAVESGSLSDKDLIIATPTLEELGLLKDEAVRARWEKAVKAADDMRASNIASRVRSKEVKEKLAEASDNALKKAVEEVVRGLMVYVLVDISGSMEPAIEAAKSYVARFLQGFPLDRVRVAVFNTVSVEVSIKHPSAAGVQNAFKSVTAGGGTAYKLATWSIQQHKPAEGDDALFIYIGDECDSTQTEFSADVVRSGLNPVAFGLIPIVGSVGRGSAVRNTAKILKIPCFEIDTTTFADPYAIPRTLRNLIASTPAESTGAATAAPRMSLARTILSTPLLAKPHWA
jgi:hypothetical protein